MEYFRWQKKKDCRQCQENDNIGGKFAWLVHKILEFPGINIYATLIRVGKERERVYLVIGKVNVANLS